MPYEYSLVCFTVFGQLAAGLALLIWLAGLDRFPEIEWAGWSMALVSGIIAAVGATLHLSNPFAGVYSVTQFQHAWLSREILCGAVFGLLVLLRLRGVIGENLNALVGIVGLAFVLVMARVYRVEIMPLWNTAGTELAFLGTALMLGGAGVAALAVLRDPRAPDCRIVTTGAVACLAGMVGVASQPLFWLGVMPQVAGSALYGSFTTAAVCMGLTQLGAIVVGAVCMLIGRRGLALWFGALLVLSGAVVGRMLFYAASTLKVGI